MKLQFLGTAAAEAAPALFCTCKICRYAREKGGREIRTRSGAMIDDTIKLDFGPDSYMHSLKNGLDYSHLHSILITHSHADHFSLDELALRMPPYAHTPENDPPLTIYGNARVGEMLSPHLNAYTRFQRMIPFEPVEIEGYRVTALEAIHCVSSAPDAAWPVVFRDGEYRRSEEALFYLIEKDGESVLYAHDTSGLTPADAAFLTGKRISIISLDCTNGVLDLDYVGHMGIPQILSLRETLLQIGAADEKTIFVANHFSHNGLLPHAEMEARLPGFLVSYDSMIVETK